MVISSLELTVLLAYVVSESVTVVLIFNEPVILTLFNLILLVLRFYGFLGHPVLEKYDFLENIYVLLISFIYFS